MQMRQWKTLPFSSSWALFLSLVSLWILFTEKYEKCWTGVRYIYIWAQAKAMPGYIIRHTHTKVSIVWRKLWKPKESAQLVFSSANRISFHNFFSFSLHINCGSKPLSVFEFINAFLCKHFFLRHLRIEMYYVCRGLRMKELYVWNKYFVFTQFIQGFLFTSFPLVPNFRNTRARSIILGESICVCESA